MPFNNSRTEPFDRNIFRPSGFAILEPEIAMAVYYFDVDDGDSFTRDDSPGVECSSIEVACTEALRSLPEIAMDDPGPQKLFSVRVRDDSGIYVFEASLQIASRRLDPKTG